METNEVIETDEAGENVIAEEATADDTTLEKEGAGVTLETEETEEDTKQQRDNGYLKRINKITYQREEEKRRGDALQEKLDAALEAAKAAVPPQGKPEIEDFETDVEYFDSLTDWKLEQRDAAVAAKKDEAVATRSKAENESAYRDAVAKTNADGMKKYADYEEVVFSLPPDVLDEDMVVAVLQTESPDEVAYHLAKNPKAAARISKLSPVRKSIEIGKIEERLSRKKETTKAPPPINPLKGKDNEVFDEEKLSDEKWIQLRNEGKI